MKIITILGARPQFIKAGTVSREISKRPELKEIIIHTGQHYDANMSDVFFDEMSIPKPCHNLGIGGNSHGAMTGQMLEKIETILLMERPDWVLVYGDTNSTLAGALAASKLHIKIAHIEAGLRSFNMAMPEEINRILTDRVSQLLFCPTSTAIDNLLKEGIDYWSGNSSCLLVGDVMQDGAYYYSNFAKKPSNFEIQDNFVLCTIHRAENTDDIGRLTGIINALNEVSQQRQVVLPLHPRTRKILADSHLDISQLTVISPVGYLNMIWLIKNSACIFTDSGGLQKEAFFFEKPCITMRDETEWVELVDSGVNFLAGADKEKILAAFEGVFSISENYNQEIYGSGCASKKIVQALINY